MNIKYTEDIKDNTFSALLQFDSYGSLELSAEDEQLLLEDFPIQLVYADITFSGKYGLDDKNNVIKDDTNGDLVNFVIPNKKIFLDTNFKISYSINTNQILDSELGTKL